ncbi:MAG: hypothetical protein ACOC29_00210 [Candidatus Sumerlaeota bacterium]
MKTMASAFQAVWLYFQKSSIADPARSVKALGLYHFFGGGQCDFDFDSDSDTDTDIDSDGGGGRDMDSAWGLWIFL